MSINIRGSLLVVAGTFLFKVITIEHTNTKVFFYHITKRYIALWTGWTRWTDVYWNLWVEPAAVIKFDRFFWRGGEGRMYWCTIFRLNVSITWFTMCPWPAPWRKLMAGAKLGRPVRQYNQKSSSLKFKMTAMFISCFATESFHCWLWIICTRRAGHVQCMLQDSWDFKV